MDKVNVLEIFRLAERVESCATEFYRTVASQVEKPVIRKVFSLIAQQEQKHENTYTALRVQASEEIKDSAQELFQQASQFNSVDAVLERFHPDLKSRVERFIRAEKGLVSSAAIISDPVDAIELAIAFEETTIELYKELQKHVSLASKPRVEVIINEEKRHLREFISLKAKVLRARLHSRSI